MSTQRFDLTVETREAGKHFSRSLRKDRKIPAVVYGSTGNKNVYLDENTVVKYNTSNYENALFNLKSSDSKLNNIVVMMKEVIVHPVNRRPEHVDLFALDLTKPVRLDLEVKVTGKAAGVAEGGILSLVNRTIEIECLPTQIPDALVVDVSGLGLGDALHVSDLAVPEGVKVISAPEMTIATVTLLEEEVLTPTPAADAAATPVADATAAPAAAAPAAGAKK